MEPVSSLATCGSPLVAARKTRQRVPEPVLPQSRSPAGHPPNPSASRPCAPHRKPTPGRHLRRARQGRSWGSLCSHGIQNVPRGQQESLRQPPTTQLSEGPGCPEGSPWAPSRGERPVQGKGTRKPRVMKDASSGKPHGRHLLRALEKGDATAQVSGASGTALSRALPRQPDRPGAGGHPRPEPLLPRTLGTQILSTQITQND